MKDGRLCSKYSLSLVNRTTSILDLVKQYPFRVASALEAFRLHQDKLALQQSPIEEQQNHCTRTDVPLVLIRSALKIPICIADSAFKSILEL